jgi:hypothetical protein
VIPAAEKAVETGRIEPLLEFMTRQVSHSITERFEHVAAVKANKAPTTAAELPAARERVAEELGFIGYVEGAVAAKDCRH